MTTKTAKAGVVPVRQRTQFSCMAASMSMCLKALGYDTDEDTVNRVMGAQPMKGASWEQALACAQHYGCRATLTTPCTVEQLRAWTDAGIPVMIAWNPEGRPWSHASVVYDVVTDESGQTLIYVADPNIPNPKETTRVVTEAEFYGKWYEKWPDYLVRRPACAIEREITPDGRQVRMASQKTALKTWDDPHKSPAGVPYPKSKWDRLGRAAPFRWATPAPNIDGSFPEPWRVTDKDAALVFLKKMFPTNPDIYTDYETDLYRGLNRIWVGLRDNRDKQAHYTRLLIMHDDLKAAGWPVLRDNQRNVLWLLDDVPKDVLRKRGSASSVDRVASRWMEAKASKPTSKTQDEKRREQTKIKVEAPTPRNEAARALAERGNAGAGKHHTRERDVEKGKSRKEKHKKDWREKDGAYSGNPDGEPIYPRQIDHGENQALSGGHDIMKRLQDQLRIEQGHGPREPNPRLAAGAPEWVLDKPFRGRVNDAFIAKIKAHPELRHVFMMSGRGHTLVMADYFDDPEYNGGSEYDVYFFPAKEPGWWEINVGMTKGTAVFKMLETLLRVKPSRMARLNANTSTEAEAVNRLAKRFVARVGGVRR